MNDPIFLLSCGPRTGSTWLQRCLIRNGVMVWGERVLIEFLHLMIDNPYVKEAKEEGKDWNYQHFLENKDRMWTAVLNPPYHSRILHHFCSTHFSTQAIICGYDRWGVKETMWRPGWDYLFEQPFHEARIVYLTRNFLQCYRSRYSQSYKPPDWGSPELDWTPYRPGMEGQESFLDRNLFCRRWAALNVHAWHSAIDEPNSRRFVRYEDLLRDRKCLNSVLDFCGAQGYEESEERIGHSTYLPLSEMDRRVIAAHESEIRGACELVGYEWEDIERDTGRID